MRVRKISALVVAGVAVTLSLTACSGGSTGGASTSSSSSASAPATADAQSGSSAAKSGQGTAATTSSGTTKKSGVKCTDQLDYAGDPRSNAEINSIGEDTGHCPQVQH